LRLEIVSDLLCHRLGTHLTHVVILWGKIMKNMRNSQEKM